MARSGILTTENFTLDGGTATLEIPIEDAHIPNLNVQVDVNGASPRLDDKGQPIDGAPDQPAYATGTLQLTIPPLSRALTVEITPDAVKLDPGAETGVRVRVVDAQGAPVEGAELAIVVVDEAVLALTGYQLADPLATFYAARGAGAYLNGTELPLRQGATRLSDAVAGVDFKRISHHLGDELAVRPPYYSQRNFGSSALEWCFVAAGRLDVYLHGGQMLWDYAAGRLILAEAGGVAEALDGGVLMSGPAIKRGVIAATSPALFTEWSAWVKARS